MRIGAIILAAGASSRLGRPKQLLNLNGELLLERAVRIATDASDLVVVVLGCEADRVQRGCDLGAARVVLNEDWQEGMGSSISAGLRALSGFDGALLMTCDMPAVSSRHLRQLVETGLAVLSVVGSSYEGRCGVPAFFPASSFADLLNLQGERGAHSLLRDARTIELASGEVDVDTMDDYERAKAAWPSRIH